jgi:hypothetical protein
MAPQSVQVCESTVEEAVLERPAELDFAVLHGPDIALSEPAGARETHGDVLLVARLCDALQRLNPTISSEALKEPFSKVARSETPNLAENNRRFHQFLSISSGATNANDVRLQSLAQPRRSPPVGGCEAAGRFAAARGI